MEKKAAILTWCDNNGPTNYGQILQCYAMQLLVRRLGWEPVVIQYRKKDKRDFISHNFSNRTVWGRKLNELYEKNYNIKVIEKKEDTRVKRFRAFIHRNIPLSPPCYTLDAVNQMTDDSIALVCGSDQIWNPVWFDPIWFLDFGRQDQLRIAYAPSGILQEDEESVLLYHKMIPLIEKMDKVSLRESKSIDILKRFTDKEMVDVLDPTLLLTVDDWNLVASPCLCGEEYLFCYVIGSVRPYQLILRRLMEKYEAKKVLFIPSNMVDANIFPFMQSIEDAGPAEFISLVKNAKAICTDSFHGTVLSLLYHKQFYNVMRVQPGAEKFTSYERIENILDKADIHNRLISNCKEIDSAGYIDYNNLPEKWEKERRRSGDFLREALNG